MAFHTAFHLQSSYKKEDKKSKKKAFAIVKCDTYITYNLIAHTNFNHLLLQITYMVVLAFYILKCAA